MPLAILLRNLFNSDLMEAIIIYILMRVNILE